MFTVKDLQENNKFCELVTVTMAKRRYNNKILH